MARALVTLVVMGCAYPLTMSVITTWTAEMSVMRPTAADFSCLPEHLLPSAAAIKVPQLHQSLWI